MKSLEITASILLTVAIEDYAMRHHGRRPARVFVSDEMYDELVADTRDLIHYASQQPGDIFCGVPIIRYGHTGRPEYYLSDREAI